MVLLAGLFATTLSNNGSDTSAGGLLFPDLKAEINDLLQVSISKAGESVTLRSESGQWVLAEYKNYPVDTRKLRQLLLSLADAKKLEEKTSKVEMYGRLGVEDTSADSQGIEIRLSGPDSVRSLIIGNLARWLMKRSTSVCYSGVSRILPVSSREDCSSPSRFSVSASSLCRRCSVSRYWASAATRNSSTFVNGRE